MAARKLTPADLRERARIRLEEHGTRRKELAAELAALEAKLKPLVVEAYRAEVGYRVINELTGLSSRTIRAWTLDPDGPTRPAGRPAPK